MAEIDLLDRYPRPTRPVEARGALVTEAHRAISREFGKEYFDGDRMYGYGGYAYHPRFWTETVRRFRDHYRLAEDAAVLDVGCAKGFMMHDFKLLIPKMTIAGIDISQYAYDHAIEDMKPFITVGNATKLPWPDRSFDLVIAINTIHNLPLEECKQALREIQRVTRKDAYVTVDAWRTEAERDRLEKWILTARSYMHVDDWKRLFDDVGYRGDHFWFICS